MRKPVVSWDWICGLDVGFDWISDAGTVNLNLGIVSLLIVYDTKLFYETYKEHEEFAKEISDEGSDSDSG